MRRRKTALRGRPRRKIDLHAAAVTGAGFLVTEAKDGRNLTENINLPKGPRIHIPKARLLRRNALTRRILLSALIGAIRRERRRASGKKAAIPNREPENKRIPGVVAYCRSRRLSDASFDLLCKG